MYLLVVLVRWFVGGVDVVVGVGIGWIVLCVCVCLGWYVVVGCGGGCCLVGCCYVVVGFCCVWG